MIDNHGAQCGFCTPGFVMSLYAGWCSGLEFNTSNIESLLSGNLCRCTGYGPIVRAGEALANMARPQWAIARLQADIDGLRKMQEENAKKGWKSRFGDSVLTRQPVSQNWNIFISKTQTHRYYPGQPISAYG